MAPDFLAGLNAVQKQAVTFPSGNLLVLAGAGSGKTRVLVHRIAWLLSQGADLQNILAVTFTNKAAKEMRSRLEQMLQISLVTMWIGTFHSLTHRILRLHWQESGLNQSFQILDAEDQLRLLKKIHKALNLDQEKWPVKQSQSFISHHKEHGIRVNNLTSHDIATRTLINIYRCYEEMCESSGLVDFAELLLRTYELWKSNQSLRDYYQKRFQHILVDEFQDTNPMQYTWLKLLASAATDLTAVGDDDQSIYSWRGADSNNIRRLKKDYPNMYTIRLEQNYRSTANILGAANAVIAHNNNRLGKELWTEAGNGDPIVVYAAYNEIDEARYVVNKIHAWVKQGSSFNDIAVLYRANVQSRVIEEQLLRFDISYRVYGGVRFFERAEIKDVLAYLRLLINHHDGAAFERVINLPPRGIGEAALGSLRHYTKLHNCSLWSATQAIVTTNQLPGRSISSLDGFIQLINESEEQIANLDLALLIEFVIDITKLRTHYSKSQSSEYKQSRLENLCELIIAAKQFATFDTKNKRQLLQNFLSHVALESGEHVDHSDDCVKLMTLHSAKGLEFPVVFLCGMEEGLFPHAMSMKDQGNLEEERRLCYVGMTRAKQKLYLSYANSRQLYDKRSLCLPSRFLREIPQDFITHDTLVNKVRPALFNITSDFYLGQRVFNKDFGEGVITGFEGQGKFMLVRIKFKQFGNKILSLQHASIKAM
ncbi:MAG: DNA helicase II [Coxiellaceae bacterium]|jgi:DNA helicase-2/ATP-dependent DNA helicase PcrA|nr:DNA helicase II [Coxiellaceae bacterium]